MTEWVYFAKCGDAIKVGVSRNVKARIGSLASATALPVEFLGSVHGDRKLERHLHRMLRDYRIRSEWYHDCDSVRAVIRRMISTRIPRGDVKKRQYAEAIDYGMKAIATTARKLWGSDATKQMSILCAGDVRSAQRYLSGDRFISGDSLIALLQSEFGDEFFRTIRAATSEHHSLTGTE